MELMAVFIAVVFYLKWKDRDLDDDEEDTS